MRQIVTLINNAPSSMHSGTTWYLHGDNNDLFYEKEQRADGMVEHKHYLSAGGLTFAIQTLREGNLNGKPQRMLNYLHHDHLGSVSVVSSEAGSVTETMAYDPWGKRRNTNGVADTSDSIVPTSTERGFTMHEHLDELGIIHMNGRIYDPYTGRFMSADPFIQDPGNLQSYNRYAYVMNNPLNMTDPSGYFSLKKVARVAVAVVALVYAQDIGSWAKLLAKDIGVSVAIVQGAVGGSIVGYVATGTLQGTLGGGLSGALFGWIGNQDLVGFNKVLAHAAGGCAMGMVTGGGCGPSSLAAGAAALIGPSFDKLDKINQGIARAVVGGTFSVIGGGKFANGALTAAYAYAFNDAQHSRESKVTLYGRIAVAEGIGDRFCEPSCIHLSIVIQDQYSGVTLIDGQPRLGVDTGSVPPNQFLSLGTNIVSDFQKNSVFQVDLQPPSGMSMRQFATALLVAAANFPDGTIRYSFPYLPSGNMPTGYNSNSYAAGLLNSVLGSVPVVDFGLFQAPGWKSPIRTCMFQKSGC